MPVSYGNNDDPQSAVKEKEFKGKLPLAIKSKNICRKIMAICCNYRLFGLPQQKESSKLNRSLRLLRPNLPGSLLVDKQYHLPSPESWAKLEQSVHYTLLHVWK